MMDGMALVRQLAGCCGAAALFGLLFHAPRRCIVPAALAAAAGYAGYLYVAAWWGAEWVGTFAGTVIIALISELSARRLRAPAIIFTSVAIIPLVPGAGLYNTMRALIDNGYLEALKQGTGTLLSAGAIAMAIAVVTALMRAPRSRRPDKAG